MAHPLKALKKKSKRAAVRRMARVQVPLLTSIGSLLPILHFCRLLDRERSAFYQAWALTRLDRHQDALKVLVAAVKQAPDNGMLVRALGEVQTRLGRIEEAQVSWLRTIALDPFNQKNWMGYAESLYSLKRLSEIDALIDRRLALNDDPSRRFIDAIEIARRYSPRSFERLTGPGFDDIRHDEDGLRRLARIHARAGDLGIALSCLNEAAATSEEPRASLALRRDIMKKLRALDVDWDKVQSEDRATLRMPELPLQALIRKTVPLAVQERRGICMVVTSLGPGGAERQLANTVNGLREGGLVDDLTIVQMTHRNDVDDFYRSHLADPPVTVSTMGHRSIDMKLLLAEAAPHVGRFLPVLPSTLRGHVARFATEFAERRPQVVHCWSDRRNMTAGIAAVIMRVPRVILGTRSISPVGNRTVPRYFQPVYRALLACDHVRMINNSRAGADSYASWLEVDPARIDVVYNGIDVQRLHAARSDEAVEAHRTRLRLGAKTRIVGSVIRFTSEKRPELWLEAAARLAAIEPEVHFVLIGDGIGRPRAEALCRELGIGDRTHFIGLVKDVVPWYQLMDVVLMTSSREGTSNTILEAQALGRPVITTAVGGMPEAVSPGVTGRLMAPHPRPEEIAVELKRALEDAAWRHNALTAGPAFIKERFSIEAMARDTFALYDTVPSKSELSDPRRMAGAA